MNSFGRMQAGLFAALVLGSGAAQAGDADQDGVTDIVDAYPCDGAAASVVSSSALLAFEERWQTLQDLDFNDVVVRTQVQLFQDAEGRTRRVLLRFDPLALGSAFDNGLALRLPVSADFARVRRRVGNGPWTRVAAEPDAALTLVASPSLRRHFGGQAGPINTRPEPAPVSAESITLEVELEAPGVNLDAGVAPFDVFIFRADDFSLQTHLPQFSSFNSTQEAANNAAAGFAYESGLPFALDIQTSRFYAREGVAIDRLFPKMLGFATSSGLLDRDFYLRDVQAQLGYELRSFPLPEPEVPDLLCTFTFQWATGPFGPCTGGSGTWTSEPWSSCSGAPNDCGTGLQTQTHACTPTPDSGVQSRAVWCARSDGVTVLTSRCREDLRLPPPPSSTRACTPLDVACSTQRPADATQVCTVSTGCDPVWNCGPWTMCTNQCGGTQSCDPVCQVLFDGVWMDTTSCTGTPESSRACGTSGALGFTWVEEGNWSACSDACGGTQTQTVWCRDNCSAEPVIPSECQAPGPSATKTCGGVDGLGYEWQASNWTACSDLCGGSQTRAVGCYRVCDGAQVDSSLCPAASRPAASQSCGFSGALSYGWVEDGNWSACTNVCGGSQTQTVWCRENCSLSAVDPGECQAPAPASTRSCGGFEGLGNEWRTSSWSVCSNVCDGVQNRDVGCYRRCDGALLPDSSCAGARPASTQACGNLTALGYSWRVEAWSACSGTCGGTQSRRVTCARSCDGAAVVDSFCSGARPADAQSCGSTALTFTWVAQGDWTSCSNVCGGTQTQTVWCRNDCTGAAVSGSFCSAPAPSNTRTCGDANSLGSGWQTSSWSACSNLCGGTQTRTASCRRRCDGATMPSSSCVEPAPTTIQACGSVATLGYAWDVGAWSACMNACGGDQTRPVVCKRACDGAVVSDSFCGALTKPATSQHCGGNSGLGYQWWTSDWTPCSNGCGGTQERTVGCIEQCTGYQVDDALCPAPAPEPSRACGSADHLGGSWQFQYPACSTCTSGESNPPEGLWCRRECDGANLGTPATCFGQPPPPPQSCPACVASCKVVQTTYWARPPESDTITLPAIGPIETGCSGTRTLGDRYSARCSVVGGAGRWSVSPFGSTSGECWISGRKQVNATIYSLGFAEDDPATNPIGGSWSRINLSDGNSPTYTCGHAGFGAEIAWPGGAGLTESNTFHCTGTAPDRTCYYVRYCR